MLKEELYLILGRRMKAVRRSRKIEVDDLADRLGKSSMTVYSWESGKQSPTVLDLRMICKILRVKADYLMGLTEEP